MKPYLTQTFKKQFVKFGCLTSNFDVRDASSQRRRHIEILPTVSCDRLRSTSKRPIHDQQPMKCLLAIIPSFFKKECFVSTRYQFFFLCVSRVISPNDVLVSKNTCPNHFCGLVKPSYTFGSMVGWFLFPFNSCMAYTGAFIVGFFFGTFQKN